MGPSDPQGQIPEDWGIQELRISSRLPYSRVYSLLNLATVIRFLPRKKKKISKSDSIHGQLTQRQVSYLSSDSIGMWPECGRRVLMVMTGSNKAPVSLLKLGAYLLSNRVSQDVGKRT